LNERADINEASMAIPIQNGLYTRSLVQGDILAENSSPEIAMTQLLFWIAKHEGTLTDTRLPGNQLLSSLVHVSFFNMMIIIHTV